MVVFCADLAHNAAGVCAEHPSLRAFVSFGLNVPLTKITTVLARSIIALRAALSCFPLFSCWLASVALAGFLFVLALYCAFLARTNGCVCCRACVSRSYEDCCACFIYLFLRWALLCLFFGLSPSPVFLLLLLLTCAFLARKKIAVPAVEDCLCSCTSICVFVLVYIVVVLAASVAVRAVVGLLLLRERK